MVFLRSWLKAFEWPRLRTDFGIFAVGAVICLGLTGYFQMQTGLPASLDGDHLFLLTTAKSYINGHGFRFDSHLGFPDERDYLYFPSFDLSFRSVLWLAAHLTQNPFRAAHMLYVFGLVAMFGFAYWTLRRLGVRAWLAVIGSLASIMTHFLAIRAYIHDTLALSISVPLGLGLALSIGLGPRDRGLKRLFADPYVLVAVLIIGTSGLYYAFYSVILTLFAAVGAGAAQRRLSPLIMAMAVSIPIFLLLVFSGFGFDLGAGLSLQAAQPHRMPYEQLLNGLDLPASALPFRFLPKVADAVAQSQAAVPAAFANEGIGEWPALALTLVLLTTPLILAGCQLLTKDSAQREDPRLRLIGFCSALVVFAMLFAARGGIGYLFNLLVSPVIRADARIMPFLTLAAIILVCAGAELASSSSRVWMRWGGPAAAAVVLLVSAKSEFGILHRIQVKGLAVPSTQAARTSFPAMLLAKDQAGLKTVLQLPVVSWAEAPLQREFQPYAHQIAYIYDRPGSPTRWSYGSNERQPWFYFVQFEASDLPHLDQRARMLGFDSALVAKSAYDPRDLIKLQAAILKGGACRLYEDPSLALYALNGGAC